MFPTLLFCFPNTYSDFKLCERRHVNDTHSFLTALHFRLHNLKPVWLVESLALFQGKKVYETGKNKVGRKSFDTEESPIYYVTAYKTLFFNSSRKTF